MDIFYAARPPELRGRCLDVDELPVWSNLRSFLFQTQALAAAQRNRQFQSFTNNMELIKISSRRF